MAGSQLALRLIPRIESYRVVLALAQTNVGKLTLLAIFGAGLWYAQQPWLPLIVLLTLVNVVPKYRRIVVTVGTLGCSSRRRAPRS